VTYVVLDHSERAPRAILRRSARRYRSRLSGGLAALLTAFVLAGAWWWLAPPQLGGSTTLVVVDGSSMAPNFRRSDLVALRPAASYRVGDIVGYRSALLHRVVLHRIVAIENGRFALKGDNNSFRDAERVPKARVVGKLWLHVGRVGEAIQALKVPWIAAALVALLVVIVGAGPGGASRERPRW
jgi:signal peptidase I